MASHDIKKGRWYVRRGSRIQGPFPNQLISRYLILGRMDLDTEVSPDQEHWAPVNEFKALVPDVVLNANTPEGHKALMLARIREDERSSKSDQDLETSERRVDEDQVIKLHRQLRDDILQRYHDEPNQTKRNSVIILVLAIIIIVAFVMYRPADTTSGSDCTALAKPGVNWSSCNKQGQSLAGMDLSMARFKSTLFNGVDFSRSRLDGSDFSYANLSQAQLQQTSLRSASLVGATLRLANLQGADLRGADLSYADLEGAKLEGANLDGVRLDQAIWINGQQCLAGSLGVCLLAR